MNLLSCGPQWLWSQAAAAAKSFQLCPNLCNLIDGSPPGFPVPGILQARTLEWVAISSSNACKWKVTVKSLSRVWLLATPWTVAHQAPPSMGFSRQEYWVGCHCLLWVRLLGLESWHHHLQAVRTWASCRPFPLSLDDFVYKVEMIEHISVGCYLNSKS